MALEVLEVRDGRAVLVDTGTDWAFGPVFESVDHAEAFLCWLGKDPRQVMLEATLAELDPDAALERQYSDWLAWNGRVNQILARVDGGGRETERPAGRRA